MIKKYLAVVLIVFIITLIYGIAAPNLISNGDSDIAVWVGIILCFIPPILIYLIIDKYFIKPSKKENDETND